MTYKPAINAEILDRLFDVVESRKGSDADASYTAKLLAAGTPRSHKGGRGSNRDRH